jgi:hypothetical protein
MKYATPHDEFEPSPVPSWVEMKILEIDVPLSAEVFGAIFSSFVMAMSSSDIFTEVVSGPGGKLCSGSSVGAHDSALRASTK